jgi:soluble lytic murein transglycosylase
MAYLLATAGKKIDIARDMFKYAIDNSKSKGEIATIIRIVKSINDEGLTNSITRFATYQNVFFIEDSYPVLAVINKKNKSAHLVHSIIKQESGFYVTAVSSAGATGFMQVLPSTAEFIAKKMGLKYDQYKLKHDPVYNIQIGSYYISSLIDRYNGSELLAIAAYNAGPTNVNRWIDNYFDPRDAKDINDVVDWVELISFPETRNYVQKILEGAVIYKYILKMDEVGYEVL